MPSTISWLKCWNDLRTALEEKTSWGKNELRARMDKIEREELLRNEEREK